MLLRPNWGIELFLAVAMLLCLGIVSAEPSEQWVDPDEIKDEFDIAIWNNIDVVYKEVN